MSSDFMGAVTIHDNFRPKKRKSVITSTISPSICHKVKLLNAMILVFFFFKHLVLNRLFNSPLSPSRGSLVPLNFLPLEWYLDMWGGCCFSLWDLTHSLSLFVESVSIVLGSGDPAGIWALLGDMEKPPHHML